MLIINQNISLQSGVYAITISITSISPSTTLSGVPSSNGLWFSRVASASGFSYMIFYQYLLKLDSQATFQITVNDSLAKVDHYTAAIAISRLGN